MNYSSDVKAQATEHRKFVRRVKYIETVECHPLDEDGVIVIRVGGDYVGKRFTVYVCEERRDERPNSQAVPEVQDGPVPGVRD